MLRNLHFQYVSLVILCAPAFLRTNALRAMFSNCGKQPTSGVKKINVASHHLAFLKMKHKPVEQNNTERSRNISISHRGKIYRYFLKDFIYQFQREGKEGNQTLIDCLLHVPRPGTNLQPRPVPDQEMNWGPFALQNDIQPTEPHQPGLYRYSFGKYCSQLLILKKYIISVYIPLAI